MNVRQSNRLKTVCNGNDGLYRMA